MRKNFWRTAFLVTFSAMIVCGYLLFSNYRQLARREKALLECIGREKAGALLQGDHNELINLAGPDGHSELCERDIEGHLHCLGTFDVMERERLRRAPAQAATSE
jgi:hypothetical protein